MPRLVKIALVGVVLSILGFAFLFPVIAQRKDARQRSERAARHLNRNLLSAQKHPKGILLVFNSRTKRSGSLVVNDKWEGDLQHEAGVTSNHSTRKIYVAVTPGTHFSFQDRHWSASYRVEAVRPEGVEISWGTESETSLDDGSVLVKWK